VKKLLAVITLVLIVYAVYARDRLFLRDPLAHVMHDGARESGAQIYINFSNDALIENDNPPMNVLLLQHNNHAGLPKELKCLHGIVCLTDADQATLAAPASGLTIESMTSKQIRYRTGNVESAVTLY
jgi:hypothetical protein